MAGQVASWLVKARCTIQHRKVMSGIVRKVSKKIETDRQSIVDYWSSREDESGLGTDWDEALNRCWRCGDFRKHLHRCHIVAAQSPLNGPDVPSNFVLLCGPCHAESPGCPSSLEMFKWIRRTAKPFYDTFWGFRSIAVLEDSGLPAVRLCELVQNVGIERWQKAVAKYLDKCGVHFGPYSKSFSDESRAWAMENAYLEILAESN